MFSILRHFTRWTNWLIVVAVGVLVAAGVGSIWAADPDHAKKQALFAVLGTGILLLVQLVDYRLVGRWAWGLHIFALLGIAYTLLPFVRLPGGGSTIFMVPQVNGAYCWINFGLLRFQPAEVAKITYVLTLARYMRFRESQRSYAGLVMPFVATLVPVVMILKQPDLGMSLAFIPVLFAMLFAAGSRRGHLLTIAGAGLVCIPILWCMGDERTPILGHLPPVVKKYQRERVYAMLHNDERTLQRSGFQQHNALIAFGSGGVFGKGTGQIDVGRRIPENHNDMIFALVGEQWGLVGAGAVLLAYAGIFLAGIEAAGSTRDPFGRLIAVGLTAMLATGAFENLMVVLKLMPVTGVTLPFVSYGGSSLLSNFVLVALLINVTSRRPIVMGRSTFEFDDDK